MLRIDLPTQAQIEQLALYRGQVAISIFLKTTPLTQNANADRIELKNLLKSTVEQLQAADTAKRAISAAASHIEDLIEDDEFWTKQANSLAIFASPDSILTFRLPNHLSNAVEISDRFHLSPLIRSVTFAQEAYILAIGIGSVRLIELTADLPPASVAVQGLPKDFNQALHKSSHVAKDIDMAGASKSSENGLLTRYARTVDAALRPFLAGQTVPLIVAAAEPMASIYRSVCSYSHLAADVIAGSADHTPDHELANRARQILDGIYADELAAFKDLYAQRETRGRATSDLAQAARAATFGALDTLMVDFDASVSGYLEEEDGALTIDSKPDARNYSVLDEVVRRALRSGARVMAVRSADLPAGGELAAILRYSI